MYSRIKTDISSYGLKARLKSVLMKSELGQISFVIERSLKNIGLLTWK